MSRFFQYIAGDRRGELLLMDDKIGIVQEGEMTFVNFKDGSRMNTDLIAEINQRDLSGKLMAEVSSPRNIWQFKEEVIGNNKPRIEQDAESGIKYEIPPVDEIARADGTGEQMLAKPQPKKKKITLIPPTPTFNKFGKIANSNDMAEEYNATIEQEKKVEPPAPQPQISVINHIDMSDPVNIMMEKSKKIDTEVNMTLTISLPSQHLFDVIKESFDEGEKKALEYIIESIDLSEVKKSLKEGIAEMYRGTEEVIYPGVNELGEPIPIEPQIVRNAKTDEETATLRKALEEKAEKLNKENG